jgi:hypothetical protein
MSLLKEKLLCENAVISILYDVGYFRHKFTRACEIEQATLKQSQDKMKQWYNRDTMIRSFKPGEKVIVLLCYCLFIVIQYKLNILVICN